ncbi:unnamed protein product [Periconia digitata]|uniref:Metallo-beta-lactamase domain-containing protein n=1 Tax=Periconia digitata TaxID=1303443 RepID=A0A9W4UAE6_9PLEO|nr:unnamed protein product [Periconia digitata]
MGLDSSPSKSLPTMRLLNPYPNIYAYYDGRTGTRYHSDSPNWLDDGAFKLGVATYSIINGTSALLYDAGITPEHATYMLNHVKSLGATKIMLVYSHVHNDHIAGASAIYPARDRIKSVEVIAHEKTYEDLADPLSVEEIAEEDPTFQIVLPTKTYNEEMTLQIGDEEVKLMNFDIHTPDATVAWLPKRRLLLAGDVLEDTVTYLSPENAKVEQLRTHITELRRLASLSGLEKVLPAHGCPKKIGGGGYDVKSFVDATIKYIEAMGEDVDEPEIWTLRLEEVVKSEVESGGLGYWDAYEAVHQENVDSVKKARKQTG